MQQPTNLTHSPTRETSRRARFIATGATALAGFAIVRPPARAAEFELRCGSNNTADNPSSVRMVQMFKAIERESNGRVRIAFFPNSELGGDASMLSQVRLGALDFYSVSPGSLAAVVPSAEIGFVGYAFKDDLEGLRAMDGPLGDYIRNETTAKGLHALRAHWNTGMYQVVSTTHAIRTPDDLRGFKLRVVAGRITIDFFRSFNASPTPLNASEQYTALQTKTIDGSSTGMVTVLTQKFFEVAKYLSLTQHQWSSLWLVANGATWNKLPSDLQNIIERNNTKYAVMERHDTQVYNPTFADKLARLGMAVNKVDQTPFRAPLGPYYEACAKQFGPTQWALLQNATGRKYV